MTAMPFPGSPIYARPGEMPPFRKPARAVQTLFIHCSATDSAEHDDISIMRLWHKRDRGWKDVGYHFFVTKDGTVQPGRPVEQTPAAQVDHNAGSIAVCLHGLVEKQFTQAQLAALVAFCQAVETAYGDNVIRFRGHREVANKACPVINYRQVLNLDKNGRLGGGFVAPVQPVEDIEDLVGVVGAIDLMDRGAAVKRAQERLNANGAKLLADGIFGMATHAAVIAFQQKHGLKADGVIGPITAAKLGL
jgi:N-acetyl-anhydromuramyl-L-alanine amidase AmpD